ncbi:prephenate dehydrogenase [Rickenella mellea]|uniref:Prephenate dehydrogenase [NADP(+)] n=1 Tax=Rickenella mellea TaxID=50990 RepID=A0A4Y7Q5U0_9AGAM|nr:prephenate dehydrogenase [Rickenella mellea]
MVQHDVSPQAPVDDQPTIGLIGMGEMGRMYAKYLSEAGWRKLNVCDRPENFEKLSSDLQGWPGVVVLRDGHKVSRASDFIMYSVEAEFIDKVVKEFGPSTKVGAVVAGQTSVKAPEKAAFEKYLPADVHIVSCHSLHAPTVSPAGQPLVLIKHRATDEALKLVEDILRPLSSRYVYMTYEEHDLVTANTQAVTHAAFLSMGTAWSRNLEYPWEHGYYVGGIETVKVNIMLRIYANKYHVYAGLAILNPSARIQIDQYAKSTTDLFKLMLEGNEEGLRSRLYRARDSVFREADVTNRRPILLSEAVLDRFTLRGTKPVKTSTTLNGSTEPQSAPRSPSDNGPKANSHLSLLAMVDCWAALGILPFVHLDLAATPIFRMWIGVAEYLFRSQERLDAAIDAALHDVSHRSDDLEFVVAARGWSQCVSFGNFELYERRFVSTAAFFQPRFEEAVKVGSDMIKTILDSS